MKKKTQELINLITVCNIIIIIIFIYNIIVNNIYSEKNIYKLIQKNINCNNYVLEKNEKIIDTGAENKVKIVQKEDARMEDDISDGVTKWYIDNLIIKKNKNDKVYYKQKKEDENQYITTQEMLKYLTLANEFQCYNHIENCEKYKYLKNEKFNNKNCVVVRFDNIIDGHDAIIWIDCDTGFILKEELYLKDKLETITTYSIKTNVVSDEELDIPDLQEYTYIES